MLVSLLFIHLFFTLICPVVGVAVLRNPVIIIKKVTQAIRVSARMAFFAWLCTGLSPSAQAQTDAVGSELAVKALVLDILSYTRWPKEPSTLRLCLIEPVLLAQELATITQQGNGRRVQVQRFNAHDPSIAGQCDVIYLGEMNDATRLRLFAPLQGHAILSIVEESPDCSTSAVFCLSMNNKGRMRFKVNLDALALSGVRVHPAVLKLAHAGRG